MADKKQSGIVGNKTVTDLLSSLPSQLYKYSGLSGERIEWMRKLIVDSELYFVPPSKFNDPLDCRIPPRFNASNIKAKLHWRRVAREHDSNINKKERNQDVEKLVRDSKTPEGQERLAKIVYKSLDKRGIVSLSEDPKNMLMWSYYANGHSGIALRFNMASEILAGIPGQIIPVKVNYSHEFPNINYYDINTKQFQFVQMILGTKSFDWNHEKEWRLVRVEGSGYVRIPLKMIDGIILGMRIAPDSEQLIREWAVIRGAPTELLRVKHKKNSFDLEVVDA